MKFLLFLLLLPCGLFSQSTKYDSLYKAGAITKDEYNTLSAQDSTKAKIHRYYQLYESGAITDKQYWELRDKAGIPRPEGGILEKSTSLQYDPIAERRKGENMMASGGVFIGTSLLLGVVSITAYAVNHGSNRVTTGCGIGAGISVIPAISLLIAGGIHKHHANQFDRDKELFQRQ